jgi:hypothetical protein
MSPVNLKWACFHCRKVFKKPGVTTLEAYVCPDCKQPMTMTGTAFRAPKMGDLEQWKKAEELIKNGFFFYPTSGHKPKRLADLPEFLASKRKLSPGQQLLERFQQPSKPTRARDQGRIKVSDDEWRPELSLQGRKLKDYETLEVLHEGQWISGWIRTPGSPCIELDNQVRVFVTPNLRVRFPKS